MDNDPPVFQKFKTEDGEPLENLPTCVSDSDGGRHVLWSDIQLAFKGIHSLNRSNEGIRVLFMVDKDSVRLPLCIAYRDAAYHVVLNREQGDQVEEPYHIQLMRQTPNTAAEQGRS
ncbi:hypothetical protein BG006_002634 [Podila minutissima]|uniref:Uncharacterized protein n=1 Tax=Podila minutissima TaxID=64525 RepID=A0A9P5S8Y9_9FUNG|nr:hypothetical protein BG006_002634 [Podila minutissima]